MNAAYLIWQAEHLNGRVGPAAQVRVQAERAAETALLARDPCRSLAVTARRMLRAALLARAVRPSRHEPCSPSAAAHTRIGVS
jgi:hypothetical protein